MSQPHDFPFDITDVAELLHLRIRRPSPQGLYVDCPICNDKRGKMHINTQTDTWRCNYCDESGGMLALYAKVHSISTSTAYREISDALLNGVNLSDHAVKYPDKPKETPVEAAPAADIAVRHKTYTALLAMLTLSKEHRAHLQTVRGLPDEQIERLGYGSRQTRRRTAPGAMTVKTKESALTDMKIRKCAFLCVYTSVVMIICAGRCVPNN